jgi:DNA polymerase (family X)
VARANDDVERILLEFSDLLSILSEDAHKPRAYEKAARSVGGYHADLSDLDVKGILQIPNVGKSIAEKIVEILQSGTFADLEALRSEVPTGVRELMSIPGLGPKKAMVLYRELGVASVPELVAAIDDERVATLKGFGGKTQENILRGLQQLSDSGGRVLVNVALDVAEAFVEELSGLEHVRRLAYAGSLRRMRETIGDVDLLVASDRAEPIMDAFVGLPAVSRVIAHGDAKSSILTDRALQVDLRVVPKDVWGAAMIYFTGSKAHNVRIRERAVRAGLKLNEYGLFDAKSGDLLAAETEAQVYERLGLPYIEPTLREDRGEVEASLAGELPKVLQLKDLRGDLHTHTDLTDGLAPLEEMVRTAGTLGYAYYAVTDHAPNLAMQRMTDDKILAQREQLRGLQPEHGMTLLHGAELNIDPDGDVDWPGDFLAGFDLTVASIHSHFNQTREELTRRMIRAMENPYVNVIGHPTARLIGKRPPIDLDLEAVFEAAARTGTALEVNSFPDRLDLKDEHVLWARRYGPKFAVNTDSHSPVHLSLMRFGVATAQRGWLTKENVINTWPLTRLRRFLRKGRPV